eukprot:TRINITY_DN2898_c0_g1_i1.p1 TRINITY_DN2898_c0_g1~~TRINITY_DN2898_c0_g1_i1.p1  ORF type:complete len:1651 (+),score=637.53 TRINITY_DN2898_c0_g1_i1:126-5078(+)
MFPKEGGSKRASGASTGTAYMPTVQLSSLARSNEFQVDRLEEEYYQRLHQEMTKETSGADGGEESAELMRIQRQELERKEQVIKKMQRDAAEDKKNLGRVARATAKELTEQVEANLLMLKHKILDVLGVYQPQNEPERLAQEGYAGMLSWGSGNPKKHSCSGLSPRRARVDALFSHCYEEISLRCAAMKTNYVSVDGYLGPGYKELFESQAKGSVEATKEADALRRELAGAEERLEKLAGTHDKILARTKKAQEQYCAELLLKSQRIHELEAKLAKVSSDKQVRSSVPKMTDFGVTDVEQEEEEEEEETESDVDEALEERLTGELKEVKRELALAYFQNSELEAEYQQARDQIRRMEEEFEKKWLIEEHGPEEEEAEENEEGEENSEHKSSAGGRSRASSRRTRASRTSSAIGRKNDVIENLNNEVTYLKELYDATSEQIQTLEEEKVELQENVDDLNAQVATLEVENETLKNAEPDILEPPPPPETETIMSQTTLTLDDVGDLYKQVELGEKSGEEGAQLRGINAELEEKIKSMQEEIEDWGVESCGLQQQIGELEKAAEAERTEFQTKLTASENEQDTLIKQIDSLNIEVSVLKDKNTVLREKVDHLTMMIDDSDDSEYSPLPPRPVDVEEVDAEPADEEGLEVGAPADLSVPEEPAAAEAASSRKASTSASQKAASRRTSAQSSAGAPLETEDEKAEAEAAEDLPMAEEPKALLAKKRSDSEAQERRQEEKIARMKEKNERNKSKKKKTQVTTKIMSVAAQSARQRVEDEIKALRERDAAMAAKVKTLDDAGERQRVTISNLRMALEDRRSNLRQLRVAQRELVKDFREFKHRHTHCQAAPEDGDPDSPINKRLQGLRGAAGKTSEEILKEAVVDIILKENASGVRQTPFDTLLFEALEQGLLPPYYLVEFLTDEQVAAINERAEVQHMESLLQTYEKKLVSFEADVEKAAAEAGGGGSPGCSANPAGAITGSLTRRVSETSDSLRSSPMMQSSPMMMMQPAAALPSSPDGKPASPLPPRDPAVAPLDRQVLDESAHSSSQSRLTGASVRTDPAGSPDAGPDGSYGTAGEVLRRTVSARDGPAGVARLRQTMSMRLGYGGVGADPANVTPMRKTLGAAAAAVLAAGAPSPQKALFPPTPRSKSGVSAPPAGSEPVLESEDGMSDAAAGVREPVGFVPGQNITVPKAVRADDTFVDCLLRTPLEDVLAAVPEFGFVLQNVQPATRDALARHWALGPQNTNPQLRQVVAACFQEISNIRAKRAVAKDPATGGMAAGAGGKRFFNAANAATAATRMSRAAKAAKAAPRHQGGSAGNAVRELRQEPAPDLSVTAKSAEPEPLPTLQIHPATAKAKPGLGPQQQLTKHTQDRLREIIAGEYHGQQAAVEYLDLIELVSLLRIDIEQLIKLEDDFDYFTESLKDCNAEEAAKLSHHIAAERRVLREKFGVFRAMETYTVLALHKLNRRKENILRAREDSLSKVLEEVGHIAVTHPKESKQLLTLAKLFGRTVPGPDDPVAAAEPLISIPVTPPPKAPSVGAITPASTVRPSLDDLSAATPQSLIKANGLHDVTGVVQILTPAKGGALLGPLRNQPPRAAVRAAVEAKPYLLQRAATPEITSALTCGNVRPAARPATAIGGGGARREKKREMYV